MDQRPKACHMVNRKFIEDCLLPKQVSTYIWSDVIINKPLNNNYHNNNSDFLVPENLVLNMSRVTTNRQTNLYHQQGFVFLPHTR